MRFTLVVSEYTYYIIYFRKNLTFYNWCGTKVAHCTTKKRVWRSGKHTSPVIMRFDPTAPSVLHINIGQFGPCKIRPGSFWTSFGPQLWTIRTVDNSEFGQFCFRALVNSDPVKMLSELANQRTNGPVNAHLTIGQV